MKVSELRIGNLVKLGRTKGLKRVYGVKQFDVGIEGISNELNIYLQDDKYTYNAVSIDIIKPIPLTEEWLLKFGFDKPFKTIGDFERWQKGEFRLLNGKLLPLSNVEIKYVHQLQNLYFALTGEELILKA